MLGVGNPSTRIVSKGPLLMRAVALALLGALILAASAHARGPGRGADATAASRENAVAQGADAVALPGVDTGAETAAEVGETPTPAPEVGVTAGPVEKAPEAPIPAAEEKAPEAPIPAAEEKAPEAPAPPPPEEKAPEAPIPAAEEKAPEAPAPAAEEKAPETAHPGPLAEERTLEVVPAVRAGEEPREGTVSSTATAPQDPAATEHVSGEPAPEGPSALLGSLPPSVSGPGGTSTSSGEDQRALAAATAAMKAARRAGDFICELSALGVRRSGNCGSGWLTAQRVLSGSPIGFAGAAASLALVGDGPPPGGGHGGSAVGNPPVSPANGSAPSGASGGSAMGPSGLALSGFLTLAGLLLLGAPRAMRRLRLSCEPWRIGCFVLIPERPG
ncbi:MAG: hypothetical protein JWO21_609 [Solirubrobacterales bacterium]|nr:hypothetical protein [Solirubrobacterales bacterium]